MDLDHTIPNNVGLADNPRLAALLGPFDGAFRQWWAEAGPEGFDAAEVYLRTPTGVDARGWASYGYVRLPDYRWGIYQAAPQAEARASFGALAGKSKTTEVPAEYRDLIMKLLVVQGDTEPGSVEQSRRLGATAPSLYDLRNLFQINCEEGRHLWAMVHLLFEHFGKAGAAEAEGLLARRSGSTENPRLLKAFNSPIDEWLSFLMWSTLADRDGKYQLLSMAESGFDPLARTCRFMLTEEAHHMFVGDDGLRRVLQRTAELMREHDTDDVAPHGGINLATFQRYINHWAPQTIDLFGHEQSIWAETLFDAGIKGRAFEAERYDEHVRLDQPVTVDVATEDGGLAPATRPMRQALNETLRRDYLKELDITFGRWNRLLKKLGVDTEIKLPDKRFNRRIGVYAERFFSPDGRAIDENTFLAHRADWLPSDAERAHVRALMQPCYAPGKTAGWIAPPARGIDGKAPDFAYVRL